MTNRIKLLSTLGLICIGLEIARICYYPNMILWITSHLFSFTFIILSPFDFFLEKEEQKNEENKYYEEDKMEIHLIELMLLDKVKKYTQEYLESKSLTFLDNELYDFNYYLKEYRLSLNKELVDKIEATINLIYEIQYNH